VKCKIRYEHRKQYDKKVCQVAEQHYGGDSHHNRQNSKYHHHDYKWKDRGDSSPCDNYDKRDKKRGDKTPSDRGNKAFKPCSVHGPKSKHTSEECHKTPKNDKHQLQDKKHHYKVHHNDAKDDEPCFSTNTPVPSEDPASASSKSEKTHEDENYHLHVAKKMKVGCHVPHKSDHQQQRTKSKSSQNGKKEKHLLLS
jgi:hypothetical protein